MIYLTGRTEVVSGAGAGIGRAMQAAGLRVGMVVGDVHDAASVAEVFAGVAERHGSLDVLMNNMGDFLGVMNGFEEGAEAEWDALYAVNVRHGHAATRSNTSAWSSSIWYRAL